MYVYGTVRTVPFDCPGGRLTVNAVADHLSVALLDPSGTPIPGYDHADCIPFSGDYVRHAVAWREHETLPANQPMSIEFRLKKASLYSFSVLSARSSG